MSFGDVKTPKGLEELNKFLAENSYISGWVLFPYILEVKFFGSTKCNPNELMQIVCISF